jgi:hypothetical protein
MAQVPRQFDELDKRYRHYLLILARAHVAPELHARLDVEGVVQQNLLEAWGSALDRAGWSIWLRRLLAHNLGDELRKQRAEKRDVARKRLLEADLAKSSTRLADFLAIPQSSPRARLAREEQALHAADALNQHPPTQTRSHDPPELARPNARANRRTPGQKPRRRPAETLPATLVRVVARTRNKCRPHSAHESYGHLPGARAKSESRIDAAIVEFLNAAEVGTPITHDEDCRSVFNKAFARQPFMVTEFGELRVCRRIR